MLTEEELTAVEAAAQMRYQSEIEAHKEKLGRLLAARSISYSEWSQEDTAALKEVAGVYHFFEEADGHRESIYVGKGAFGQGDDWSLCKRMNQHFHPSQKNTLLGKASSALGLTPADCKKKFETEGRVRLQWLVICKRSDRHAKLETEIRWFEYFAISVLKPQYTDG